MNKLLITQAASEAIDLTEAVGALESHFSGEFRPIPVGCWILNEIGMNTGGRVLLSVCASKGGTVFWIITEEGHDEVTILLPEDY